MIESDQSRVSDLGAGGLRQESWIGGRIVGALRGRCLLTGSVIVLLFLGVFCVAVGLSLGLASFRDGGYPDSATLLRLEGFIHSGSLYPAFDRPPYLVTLYGPLTYLLLAIPFGLAKAAGIAPEVPVRLAIAGALGLSVFLTFLINTRLYGLRSMAWLSALFAMSMLPLVSWATQIRCDFLGLGFALLSVYLFLLKNRRPSAVGSAICAGMALLVKQTFVAAPIAMIGWLLYKRRFKEAVSWSACFALTVAGGYAIMFWREPLMLKHIAAVRHPIFEYREALDILGSALSQPAALFGAAGGFLILRKRTPERLLFVTYWATSWLVAILTIPQAGGSINYFWEPLTASAVLAAAGLYELQSKAARTPIVVTVFLFILLAQWVVPVLHSDLGYLRESYANVRSYQARRRTWEAFVSVISGRRLLSTFPDVTIHSSIPEIPDPYLNNMLERRAQWNPAPVIAEIDAGVYDLVVIGGTDGLGWRGLRVWDDAIWRSLKTNYRFACALGNMEVWLPRRGLSSLLPRLAAIGCETPKRQSFLDGDARKDQAR